MRNSKGFTLIELLAVIVILAVIALIAAPVVLGIIDDARKSAAQDSALGLVSAAKLHFAEILMGTDNAPQFDSEEVEAKKRSFACTKDDSCTASVKVGADKKTIKLGLDGTVPSGDFTLSDAGKVNSDGLTFNGKYCFKIADNKVEPAGSEC